MASLPARFFDRNPVVREARMKAARLRQASSGKGPRL